MRFVKLQVFLLLVAVLLVGALAADLVLKNKAENRLTTEVAARSPETTGVQTRIRSFPFVGRLLLSGKVAQVDITAQHAGPGGVGLSDIRLRAEDVELDVGEATHGRAVVRSIGRGSVRADLGQNEINTRLPKQFQVQLQKGTAVVTGPGGGEGTVKVSPEGNIQVHMGSRSLLDIAIPQSNLLPCTPSATIVPGALRLTCDFTGVPKLLVDAVRR